MNGLDCTCFQIQHDVRRQVVEAQRIRSGVRRFCHRVGFRRRRHTKHICVIAESADQRIIARATCQPVIPRATCQPVIPPAAGQDVVPVAPEQRAKHRRV